MAHAHPWLSGTTAGSGLFFIRYTMRAMFHAVSHRAKLASAPLWPCARSDWFRGSFACHTPHCAFAAVQGCSLMRVRSCRSRIGSSGGGRRSARFGRSAGLGPGGAWWSKVCVGVTEHVAMGDDEVSWVALQGARGERVRERERDKLCRWTGRFMLEGGRGTAVYAPIGKRGLHPALDQNRATTEGRRLR